MSGFYLLRRLCAGLGLGLGLSLGLGLGAAVLLWPGASLAQSPALSKASRPYFDALASAITSTKGGDVRVDLVITQATPWRVRLQQSPPRLVVEAQNITWNGPFKVALETPAVSLIRQARASSPDWARIEIILSAPYVIKTATITPDANGIMHLYVTLTPASDSEFAKQVDFSTLTPWASQTADRRQKTPNNTQAPNTQALPDNQDPLHDGVIRVVLDPGHGGFDPGAQHEQVSEADLMLRFARELKEHLVRAGGFEVILTRDDDQFVPLDTRLSIAQRVGADVLLSLHADALEQGDASGTTIYTLSPTASSEIAALLAEQHARDDLLTGVDLAGHDDDIATVLVEIAQDQTAPKNERLAMFLVQAIQQSGREMHSKPWQQARFSVLKSPEIPSALVELGFLSSARDFQRLQDRDWRDTIAVALEKGLRAWASEEHTLLSNSQP